MGWIRELAQATGRYWWVLMSCAASTLLGIWGLIFKENNQWLIRPSFILAGLFVIVAIAMAWRDEHIKLLAEVAKNVGPNFKPKIEHVLRDTQFGGRFFVYAHLVNASDAPANVKRASLINHTTGQALVAVPFRSVGLYTNSQIHFDLYIGERGEKSERLARIPATLSDLLDSLRSEALLKGVGKEGWLCFRKSFDLKETDTALLSLEIEDAFGNLHQSPPLQITYELGAFA